MRRYGEWMEGEGGVSRMNSFRGTFGPGGSDGLMGVGLGKGEEKEGGELGLRWVLGRMLEVLTTFV